MYIDELVSDHTVQQLATITLTVQNLASTCGIRIMRGIYYTSRPSLSDYTFTIFKIGDKTAQYTCSKNEGTMTNEVVELQWVALVGVVFHFSIHTLCI